jgi:nitroreductase
MIKELIEKCRSYRRFDESKRIDDSMLISFIKNASQTPSTANLQPIKYRIVNCRQDNDELFSELKWAGYLKDWSGPAEGERPAGYIIILGDTTITKNFSVDLGICAYALSLCAAEEGIGSCMIGSVNKENVRRYFKIPEHLDILLVTAFGYPKEKVVIEEAVEGDIRYYRDENDVHHVPKRNIKDLIIDL